MIIVFVKVVGVMFMDRTVVLFVLALFFSHTVLANSGGITGHSGQQGPTCNDSGCHNGSDYQSNLSYDGFLTAEPNQSIDMSLLHEFSPPINSGMSMAGINISVSGGVLGQGAGLQKQGSELTHTFSSLARLPDNEKDWRFTWTAPETAGTVTLYACAEAVDRTGTPDNDDASAACIEKSIQVQQKTVSSDCGDSMSSSGCTLGLNASESGTVDKAGDIDFFALSVTQSGTLTLSTSGSVDTVGVFFAQGNDQYLTADNDSGSGRNFSLSQSVNPGTYYIHVRGLKASDLGAYTVTSNFSASGGSSDCGDSMSSTGCTLGLNASESGTVDKAGDIDFFALSVTQSGTLTLSTSGNVDTVGVFFAQGNDQYLTADNDSGSGRNFSLSQSVNPGTYYIHVRGLKNSDLGVYTVTSSFDSGAKAFYADNVSAQIVQSKCVACHVQNGAAAFTSLHFVPSNVTNYQTLNQKMFSDFVNSFDDATNYLLSKARGVAHGGEVQLPFGGDDYNAMVSLLKLYGGKVDSDLGSTINAKNFYDNVSFLNNRETLVKASLLLSGRSPTAAEFAAVIDETDKSLKSTVRTLMQGKNFAEFITVNANDKLLTNGTAAGDAIDVLYPWEYIGGWINAKNVYLDTGDENKALRERDKTGIALLRQPIELINYVVQNDKAYSEILTADYIMVNSRLNKTFQSNVTFADNEDETEWLPGKINTRTVNNDNRVYQQSDIPFISVNGDELISGDIIDYPHAGILNTPSFLIRYPSTATNRNRARSRWTQQFFLGKDIEASASRTNDPVALADRNNPTMNNPACIVCHIPMDPVAGAFQNYGHTHGRYRQNGHDSLADSYVYPTNGETLYQEGDTWYRDMRTPGFEGAEAPNADNSLQWLAQKIVADDRFASASVKFWWPAIYGTQPTLVPEVASDPNFSYQLTISEVENNQITVLANNFKNGISSKGAYNLKDLLVEMIVSNKFRAKAISELPEIDVQIYANEGPGRIVTPETLQNKIESTLGIEWVQYRDPDTGKKLFWLTENYLYYYLYGGIDSDGITKRPEDFSTTMRAIIENLGAEGSGFIAGNDFLLPQKDRILFTKVELTSTPENGDGQTIKENVQFLMNKIWHKNFSIDKDEVQIAYQLWLDVYADATQFKENNNNYWDYSGFNLGPEVHSDKWPDWPDWESFSSPEKDMIENHELQPQQMAWRAVISYLVTDFEFIYQ